MTKFITLFLSLTILFSLLTGCGSTGRDTNNSVGNITDATENTESISDSNTNSDTNTEPPELTESMMVALTEILGISYEEFRSYDIEKQYALLHELGLVLEDTSEKESEKNERPVYTTDDVNKGGKYIVTIQDSMGWNSYTFYYEDGRLIKVETSFQKNDEEEPWTETYEGDSLSEYKYSNMTLDEIINDITADNNNFHVYINQMD